MITYDPRNMEWEQYCALMAELFAPNQLGTVPEDEWRHWATGMNGIGYFVESGIPDPAMYDDWRDWASAMVGIMSVIPQQVV